MVYVVDINGQPLMPTKRHGKVRRLLKEEKAKVIQRCPFTIKNGVSYKKIKFISPSSHYIIDKVVSA